MQQAMAGSAPPDNESNAAIAGQNASNASNRPATPRTHGAKLRPNLLHYRHVAGCQVNDTSNCCIESDPATA
jgi:hypothetical protein